MHIGIGECVNRLQHTINIFVSAPASSDPNIPTVLGAVVDDATSLRDLGVDTNS